MPAIDPDAEARMGDDLVIAAMRTWTPERRGAVACQLTAMVRASSRAAWRMRNPTLSAREADIGWAEALYGPEIGAALRSLAR